MFTIVQKSYCLELGFVELWAGEFHNLQICPFLITKLSRKECLLNSNLPNTHASLSAVQDFCPNTLYSAAIFLREVVTNSFSVVVPAFGLICVQLNLTDRKQSPVAIKHHFCFHLPNLNYWQLITAKLLPFQCNRVESLLLVEFLSTPATVRWYCYWL